MGGYWRFSVDVSEEVAEAIQSKLYDAGCLGCEVRDHSFLSMPGAPAPDAGHEKIIAYFSGEAEPQEVMRMLTDSWPAVSPEYAAVDERDWSIEWRAQVRSTAVGKVWVGPPWMETPAGLIRVAIEPKMAFGTGDHPSTALCLRAIQDHCAACPEDSFLDLGTGSGVLAIAARKLESHPAVAVDNDPVCVAQARENAILNGTPDIAISLTPIEKLAGQFGLVVANILANTLIDMAPFIAPRVGRHLSLAGILQGQQSEVAAAYIEQGLVSRGEERLAEWVRLDLERR
jgi:ribosomal protein L11 methyltransferase